MCMCRLAFVRLCKVTQEDKDTLDQILAIQSWLFTVKRNGKFDKFREKISDLKTILFTPEQVAVWAFRC